MAGVLLLLAATARAGGPDRPDPATVRDGLLAPGREERERATELVRAWARTDPAGAAALWDELDLRGRCALAGALASTGTAHAAQVAFARGGTAPEPEVFLALLEGLVDGGERALFCPLPEGLPPVRKQAVEDVRFRWKVEEELVRLKSPSGPTGHYTGQFKGLKALGPGVTPILFDILLDRAHPLPGDGGGAPYRPLHMGLRRYDPAELRDMAANAFGEVLDRGDAEDVARLQALFWEWWQLDPDGPRRLEREDLAPGLAFSLHDLGVPGPVSTYVEWLESEANPNTFEGLRRTWDLGYAYIRTGEYERGEEAYQTVLDRDQSRALAAYNLACMYAVRSRGEPVLGARLRRKSLDYLERAIEDHNYGDWVWMEEDGDLDAIRGEPRYKALLEKLQTRYPARGKGDVKKRVEDFLAPAEDGK